MLTFLLGFALAPVTEAPIVGKIGFPNVDECSGIVRSRLGDRYWVHNDSGDAARLFAIRADGTPIVPPRYNRKEDAGVSQPPPPYEGLRIRGASNDDWEDIAYDGQNLYIADVGNNGNARRDLTIYVLKEPNPEAVESARPWATWSVAYPDQTSFPPPPAERRFDCEAMYWRGGRLYFLTKWRNGPFPDTGTSLYVLDQPKEGRVNQLRKIGTLTGLAGWVTAADISPDGRTLAVLTHLPQPSVVLFDARARDPLSKKLRTYVLPGNVGQVESLTFESGTKVLITSEPGVIRSLKITR